MSEAAKEVAAGLGASLAAQLVETIPADPSLPDVLALDVAAAAAAPAEPVSIPADTPAAPAPVVEVPALEPEPAPDFAPRLSDELRELLDEPDFDEEAALEVDDEIDPDSDEYVDPEVAKRLRALEKRNEWLEEQNVRNSKKKWVAENLRAYPLLAQYAADEVEKLGATSRRAFAREAAALNQRFEKIAAPLLDDLKKAKESLRTEAVQEARTEVATAWGTPAVGPPNVAVSDSAEAQRLVEARKTGRLDKVIGAMFREAGINKE